MATPMSAPDQIGAFHRSAIPIALGKKMITISSNFIGSFKLGDNICYNLECLRLLEEQYNADKTEHRSLIKPIVISIASVAEAVLYDFYSRMRVFTSEGVASVPDVVLAEVRAKHIDEFAKYIDHAKKRKILRGDNSLYEDLHELRKLRNRVHIQNSKRHFEYDDSDAFSPARLLKSERTLEHLLRILEEDHCRTNKSASDCVPPFELPWKAHIKKA